jgi:hypothetical protein
VLCLVCFVFKPRTLSRVVHRVYPCDTGAAVADRFHPEILASDLAQLALEPQIESARRLVSLLFERNSDYFVGKVVQTHAFTPGSVGARFHALLMRAGPVDYEDRKSAIEVQVNQYCEGKGKIRSASILQPRSSVVMQSRTMSPLRTVVASGRHGRLRHGMPAVRITKSTKGGTRQHQPCGIYCRSWNSYRSLDNLSHGDTLSETMVAL